MKRTPVATLIVAFVSVGSFASTALAQEEGQYTVSEFAFRRLERAQQALDEKKFKTAHAALTEMSKRGSLSDHEKALMWQTWGWVYVTQENLPKSVEALSKAVSFNALPPDVQLATRFNLAQVYLAAEKPKQAVQEFEIWVKGVEKPSPEALYTVAVAHAQAENHAQCVSYVDRAMAAKRKFPDGWLQLKLASLVQLERWNGAIAVLSDLVERNPRDEALWKQLSALYAQSGKTPESVATLELAFAVEALKEPSDIQLLTRNLIASGLPSKAAEVMEKALDQKLVDPTAENLELLASAHISAAERNQAVGPLTAAARKSEKASLYEELGRVHLAQKNWGASEEALVQALRLGGLRQPGEAYVMLGMVRHRQGRLGPARAAFEKALDYKNTRGTAKSWLNFISKE